LYSGDKRTKVLKIHTEKTEGMEKYRKNHFKRIKILRHIFSEKDALTECPEQI